MASEDVIELGSSDDEEDLPRPPAAASNKAKRGPKANAMVHIPQNIHGLTIKPAKSAKALSKQSVRPGNTRLVLPTVSTGRLITGGNLNNQTTIKPVPSNKRNNLALMPGARPANSKPFAITTIGTANLNPMSLMKNLSKSQVVINKVTVPSSPKIAVVKTLSKTKPKPTPQPARNPMARLPPSVTITKTSGPIKQIPKQIPIHIPKQIPMITNIASLANKPKGNNAMVPIKMPIKALSIPTKLSPKSHKAKAKNDIQKPRTLSVNPLRQANILTVELDDETDSPSSSTANNPSWYLRPEDHTNKDAKEMEKLNNAEPEPPKFIEICIEDSPVSKPKTRRASELSDAITIDDSPKHSTPKKRTRDSESEDEHGRRKTPKKKKRKKLDYHTEVPLLDNSIEIEIDPIQVDQNGEAVDPIGEVEVDPIGETEKMDTNEEPGIESTKIYNTTDKRVRDDSDKTNKPEVIVTANEPVVTNKPITKEVMDTVIEILESPVKKKKGPHSSKKPHSKPKPKLLEKIREAEPEAVVNDNEEFHPTYQKFINICLELDPSSDMKTIVEKKIKGYYKQVPKEYTHSEDFVEMVSSKILSMKAGKEKMYLYIKDVVDELNVQRKMAKDRLLQKETERKESGKLEFTEDSEFDSKRQRQIRKLEKTIRKLHRAIQKLEEQEVDFEDEEDSVYLLTERYKERMVRVHAKLCQLTNTKLPSEPRLHIESRPGQPTGPAKRLEKWINKKVPMGKPFPFPDFHDVLRMVREANNEDKLGWNEADIMEEARDLFTRCGKKLQRRRQEVEWRIAASRLPVDIDPAEDSDDLKNKLERNRLLASKKEIDVFNKYADRQSEMRLEAEEINDKEAEESPVESEDDDAVEEIALSDKEKRKERLKRLIQEKSHKKKEGKENSQSIEVVEIDDGSTSVKETNNDVQLDPELDPSVLTMDKEMEESESEVGDSKIAHDKNLMEIDNDTNIDAVDKEKEPTDTEKESTAEIITDETEKRDDNAKLQDVTDKSDAITKSQETCEKREGDRKYQGETKKSDADTTSPDKTKKTDADTKSPDKNIKTDADTKSPDKTKKTDADTKSPDKTTNTNADTKSPDKTTKTDADTKSPDKTTKTDADTKSPDKNTKSATDTKPGEEIEINSVSDGSEVDELQLLKKWYSESGNSSSDSDSDLDSPIDISDSVESDDAKDNNTNNKEVISIENSSESDTRDSNGKNNSKYNSTKLTPQLDVIEEIESSNDAMEPLKYDDEENSGDGSETEKNSKHGSENTMGKLVESTSDDPDPLKNDIDDNGKEKDGKILEDIVEKHNKQDECDSKNDDCANSTPVLVTVSKSDTILEKSKSIETILESSKSVDDEESLQFAIDSLQRILPDNPTNNDGSEISSIQADIRSFDSEIQSGSHKSLIYISDNPTNNDISEISSIKADIMSFDSEIQSGSQKSLISIGDNPTNNDISEISFSQADIRSSDSEIPSGSQKSLISIGETCVQGKNIDESECENYMSVDKVTEKDPDFDIETINNEKNANKSHEQNIKVYEDIALPVPETLEDKQINNSPDQPDRDKPEKDHSERNKSMSNEGKTIETTVLISTQDVTKTDVEENINNDTSTNNTSASKIDDSNDRNEDLGENLQEMDVPL